MTMLLFSIIIPVYNVACYLKECLDSVIPQNYADFEAICVNDGSTDGSLAILEEYADKDDRIKIISQKNKGLSGARNAGLKIAQGQYILFLDSDDWLKDAGVLKRLSENIQDEDMISFNTQCFDEAKNEYQKVINLKSEVLSGWNYYEKYAISAASVPFVCVWQRIYKRSFLEQHQLTFKDGVYHEDNLFTPMACYYAKTVKVISDVCYVYRIRSGSIMTANNIKKSKDIIKIANELVTFFSDKNIERAVLNRSIAGLYFRSFMPDVDKRQQKDEKQLLNLIDWNLCKQVCTYPRHRRMYCLLRISPILMRRYVEVESWVKNLKRKNRYFQVERNYGESKYII